GGGGEGWGGGVSAGGVARRPHPGGAASAYARREEDRTGSLDSPAARQSADLPGSGVGRVERFDQRGRIEAQGVGEEEEMEIVGCRDPQQRSIPFDIRWILGQLCRAQLDGLKLEPGKGSCDQ